MGKPQEDGVVEEPVTKAPPTADKIATETAPAAAPAAPAEAKTEETAPPANA